MIFDKIKTEMTKQFTAYISIILSLLLSACSSENTEGISLPTDDMWVEEAIDGASITIKPFTAGDEITRSSLVFGNQSLIFGWNKGDAVGLYPTAKDKAQVESTDGLLDPSVNDANKHVLYPTLPNIWRTDPTKAAQKVFYTDEPNGSQTVRIFNKQDDFEWDEIVRWSAYYPYKGVDIATETYVSRTYDYSNQKQNGLVNISAYKKGANSEAAGEDNTAYRLSEIAACAHLGAKDVMISPEMSWNGTKVNFQMRHVGSVIRLYLLAPKEKENLIIDNVKLICDSKIFYEKGKFTLLSHPYVEDSEHDYGVNLNIGGEGCQITPVGERTNMLQLTFKAGTAKTVYDDSDSYKRYITAYIMTFPITYKQATHGNLYAYVTAHKEGNSSEIHFVSKALEDKTMQPGHYYQWTSATHLDDGLYPIELTATLRPWQDIVGAGINTDLEK